LVLYKTVNQGGVVSAANREEEVRCPLVKMLVNEGTGEQGERRPVESVGNDWRERAAEKTGGIFRAGEGFLEKAVVGIVNGRIWHVGPVLLSFSI
jgi:hypothetical protein